MKRPPISAPPVVALFNGAGLRAVPFRTDDSPGTTDHAQPWWVAGSLRRG